MGTMFTQFFMFFTTLFTMFERFAKAGNHIAGWAEESSATFAEEAAIQRKARHNALLKEHGVTIEQVQEHSAQA